MKYAFYPRLDKDLREQYDVVISGYWWNFVPYTLCVAKCPAMFSFNDTTQYGGCEYPGACEAGSGSGSVETPETFYSGFEVNTHSRTPRRL